MILLQNYVSTIFTMLKIKFKDRESERRNAHKCKERIACELTRQRLQLCCQNLRNTKDFWQKSGSHGQTTFLPRRRSKLLYYFLLLQLFYLPSFSKLYYGSTSKLIYPNVLTYVNKCNHKLRNQNFKEKNINRGSKVYKKTNDVYTVE